MSGFDWSRVTISALRLGLAPDMVWNLTPREWLACLMAQQDAADGEALQAQELQALLARFPDAPPAAPTRIEKADEHV